MAARSQHPGIRLSCPDGLPTSAAFSESLQLQRRRVGPPWWAAGLGHPEVGQRWASLLCSHLGRDWTLDKLKHQTRTLSFDIPSPCQRSTFLLPPLSPPKMGGGGARPSCPGPSPFHEPGPPWAVLGSELGDLTRCHSGPCHPWARGPRWGRSRGCMWPDQLPHPH